MISISPLLAMGIKVVGLTSIMTTRTTIAALILIAVTSLITVPLFSAVTAYAQQQQAVATVYESPTNGYRIAVPPGWVIQDNSQFALGTGQAILQNLYNFEDLGAVCLAVNSLPAIGGMSECEVVGETASITRTADVRIYRYSDLQSRPEFANLLRQGKAITAADMIPLHFDQAERVSREVNGYGSTIGFDIISQQDLTIRVVAPETGQQITTVPAKLVNFNMNIETLYSSHVTKTFGLFLVDTEQENGYFLLSARWPASIPQIPPQILQIMQSFELVQQ
jgi:hypothetical protein